MLVNVFRSKVSKSVVEGEANGRPLSPAVENSSSNGHLQSKNEVGGIITAHNTSQESSQMSLYQKKLAKCVLLYDKFTRFTNSKNCKNILMGAAILNTLQLLIFFMLSLFILPVQTSRRLSTGDVYFIMEHVPDEYIDYDYFQSQTVL